MKLLHLAVDWCAVAIWYNGQGLDGLRPRPPRCTKCNIAHQSTGHGQCTNHRIAV